MIEVTVIDANNAGGYRVGAKLLMGGAMLEEYCANDWIEHKHQHVAGEPCPCKKRKAEKLEAEKKAKAAKKRAERKAAKEAEEAAKEQADSVDNPISNEAE